MSYFGSWLQFVKRELDSPPLWEQLAQGSTIVDSGLLGATVDTPFSPEEREAISRQIDAVRDYLARELPAGSAAVINTRLSQVETSLATQGRVTWGLAFVGLCTTLVWGGLMAPDQARAVLQMIASAFSRLITP